ncbi:MAG: ATP-binding protein [Solirubrobacterales bacterium]|nr:ATP-binding protein [Solirubrobacterales bacterium]
MFGRSVRGRARAVEFSGEFEHSQVVVGEHNTLNRYEGTVVQVLPAGAVLMPEPQPRPQTRLPRAGPEPLGRERELEMIREALARGQSTEFYGPPGIGKTALLAHVARAPGAAWADGVVHARVGGQPVEDVLQWLFEVFWTTKPRWAPGPLRIREYLRQLRVLVVLDDVEFSADDATALLDAVEHSTILIGGIEPHLEPTARAVALAGLPVDAAVAAYARCLRRSLDRSEERAVAQLVERLGFVPALVLAAAAAGVGLGVLVAGGGSTPTATVTRAVTPITSRPRTVTSTAAGTGTTRVTGLGATVTRTVPATTTSTSTTVTTTTTTTTSTTVTTSTSTTVTTSTTTTTIIQ